VRDSRRLLTPESKNRHLRKVYPANDGILGAVLRFGRVDRDIVQA
jgi:hypothetical protein